MHYEYEMANLLLEMIFDKPNTEVKIIRNDQDMIQSKPNSNLGWSVMYQNYK